MKKKTWIVVANGSRARVFESIEGRKPTEIQGISHLQGHAKPADLTSDKPGRTYNTAHSSHAVEPKTKPKTQEMQLFAKQIAQVLYKAQTEGQFERLYITAGPGFLGMLRSELHPTTFGLCNGHVSKDLTTATVDEIRDALPICL